MNLNSLLIVLALASTNLYADPSAPKKDFRLSHDLRAEFIPGSAELYQRLQVKPLVGPNNMKQLRSKKGGLTMTCYGPGYTYEYEGDRSCIFSLNFVSMSDDLETHFKDNAWYVVIKGATAAYFYKSFDLPAQDIHGINTKTFANAKIELTCRDDDGEGKPRCDLTLPHR